MSPTTIDDAELAAMREVVLAAKRHRHHRRSDTEQDLFAALDVLEGGEAVEKTPTPAP